MQKKDEWGRDPSVNSMRKIFKSMEMTQKELLTSLDISPYDPRLREWRERARIMFERKWVSAVQMGINMDGMAASAVYARCLAKLFASEGIDVPPHLLPEDSRIDVFLKEV